MSIYTKPKTYRQIYEQNYGPIGYDDNGRRLEIHHIDGNNKNNDISNLKLVTIQEHYDIHYAQHDWHACLLISQRMNIDPKIKSALCSRATLELFARGDHPFLDGKMSKKVQKRRVEDGTHHMIGGKIQSVTQNRLLDEGKQNFKNPKFISSSKIRLSCVCCRKTVSLSGFSQHLKKHNP